VKTRQATPTLRVHASASHHVLSRRRPGMDKSEKFWDRQAKGFAKQQQNIQLTDNKDFVNTLKYLDADDVVLDYGCGAGIVANGIADKVKEVHAIDISSKLIELARSNASERGIENVHYAHATIFDQRYENESFDAILAFRVLHVLEGVESVMHRIHELLKPGGVFISVTACMGGKWAFVKFLVSLLAKVGLMPQHINMFKLPELEGLMTKENLHIVEREDLGETPPHFFIVAKKIQQDHGGLNELESSGEGRASYI
jgi:2-polyprenyl-3-methyl-5-hydroxy-6-metoxy-1,4-benzoquinol methylase